MTSVNVKFAIEKKVEETLKSRGLYKPDNPDGSGETLSTFAHQAMIERIERMNGGVPDGT